VVSAVIPVLTFYPLMGLGGRLLGATSLFPQSITNQVMVWAVANGVLMTVLSLVIKGRKVEFAALNWRPQGLLTLVFALATVMTGYLALLLMDFLFQVDFRFWFVGLKLLSLDQFQNMLVYLLPFTLFFALALRALH